MRWTLTGTGADVTCAGCTERDATLAMALDALEASRMRNRGLRAKVLCLETDLGNAQTLIAGALKSAPAAVPMGKFPGCYQVTSEPIGANGARYDFSMLSAAWAEPRDQRAIEAAHAAHVARNRRSAWLRVWDSVWTWRRA